MGVEHVRDSCGTRGTLDSMSEHVARHDGLASRYIHPPFLLDGLKNDVRLYGVPPPPRRRLGATTDMSRLCRD